MKTPEEIVIALKSSGNDTAKREEIAGTLTGEQIKSWLENSNWKIRNWAVKIIDELRLSEYTENLIAMISDRTPAKFIDRVLGGDYYQVGFIRRNATTALGNIGSPSPEVSSVLIAALQDRYWEVRAKALSAIRKLYTKKAPEELMKAVVTSVKDKKFEVTARAIYTLGELSVGEDVVLHLRSSYNHPNIIVKTVAVEALKKLYDRGVLSDRDKLSKELENIFIPGRYTLLNSKKR